MDAFVAFFSNPIEVAGAVLTVVSIVLLVRQNVWGWPVGIAATVLYLPVFWQARLYGDMGLYVVFLVAQVYGWRAWYAGGPDDDAALAPRLGPVAWVGGLLLAAAGGTLGLGWALERAGGSLPYADGFTTSFALAAQVMQARKWVENWMVWIVVNAVATSVYVIKGLGPTAALYLILLGLAVVGWRTWHRELRRSDHAINER